jgi:hypothetical protein
MSGADTNGQGGLVVEGKCFMEGRCFIKGGYVVECRFDEVTL